MLDVLISTYENRVKNITLPAEKPGVQYLIVHQKYKEVVIPKNLINRNDVKYIQSDTIGLTKSRNIALGLSKAKLKLISDDDVEYIPGFDQIIKGSYQENKFDVGIFKIKTADSSQDFRCYPEVKKSYGLVDCLDVCSIEMVIVDTCCIKFNEEFGIGGRYLCGEESIFLFDVRNENKGSKIRFFPHYIVKHPLESTISTRGWGILTARGAVLKYGLGRYFSILAILKLSLTSKLNTIYNISRFHVFKSLMKGWYEN